MSFRPYRYLLLGAVAIAGCSDKPTRVSAPTIDASAAAAAAMTAHDKNADGALDDTELKGIPGLLEPKANARWDANNDGKIDATEISDRIGKWKESKIGLTPYMATFTLDGRPLQGATIRMVPEPWLGEAVQAGTGTTNESGQASFTIPPENLQENEAGLTGMRLGVYKFEVTHPSMTIPAKFNTATEIGREIAHDDPEPGRDVIALTSR